MPTFISISFQNWNAKYAIFNAVDPAPPPKLHKSVEIQASSRTYTRRLSFNTDIRTKFDLVAAAAPAKMRRGGLWARNERRIVGDVDI